MLARTVSSTWGECGWRKTTASTSKPYALAEHPGRQHVMAAQRTHRHDLRRAATLRVIQQRPELSQLAAAVERIRQIIALDPERGLCGREWLEALDGRRVGPEIEHRSKLADGLTDEKAR